MPHLRRIALGLLLAVGCTPTAAEKPTKIGTSWAFDEKQLNSSGPLLSDEIEKSWTFASDNTGKFDDKVRLRIVGRFAHVEHAWGKDPKARIAMVRSLKVEVLDNPRGFEIKTEVEPKGFLDPTITPDGATVPADSKIAQLVTLDITWSGTAREGCKTFGGDRIAAFRLGGDQKFHRMPKGKLSTP